jgi:hypothetical protein
MLTDVVKEISESYGDIRALARSAAVSPKEVAAALAKAKPGTVDHVVLSLLAEYHPVVDSKPTEE